MIPYASEFEGANHADYSHRPVLGREVLEGLRPGPGKRILDGTLGGGGHSELLLKAGADVIGIDQDFAALAAAGERLAAFGPRFRALYGNFRNAVELCRNAGVENLDGALLDIGVSSPQIDTPERGFSFQKEGPLDMRMDTCAQKTAADIVNSAPEAELIQIFREYGEEPSARRVAAAMVRGREITPIITTLQLVEVIEKVLPRRGPRHPATRIFQALRIAVNDELGALRTALSALTPLLNSGARFGVITFHSLEDRIVKHFFRQHSTAELDDPSWPAPRPNPDYHYRLITRHPIEATQEERDANPRARSARLRVVEKL